MKNQTSPDLWVNLHKEYDLWHAAYASKEWKRVKPIKMTVTEDTYATLNP
jgi:plasmid maintenance system antidote protein VapI